MFELENNNFIPFRDVNVFRDARRFSSSIHRKDTFSGVYTNAQSFVPETYKRGLISTLLYRAYMVSFSYLSLYEEIEKLKTIFSKNGYQKKFIDMCIFRFLDKLYTKVVATVPRKEVEIMHVRSGVCSERKISRENFCISAKEKDSYLVKPSPHLCQGIRILTHAVFHSFSNCSYSII